MNHGEHGEHGESFEVRKPQRLRSWYYNRLRGVAVCMLVVSAFSACSAVYCIPVTPVSPVVQESLLPNVAGFEMVGKPRAFAADQVFDYMDGAGEIPKGFGFKRLVSAKYKHGAAVMEAAIFDMGSSENAFGYYSVRSYLERSKTDRLIRLDHPAHLNRAIGILTFWKDRYTIILQPETGKVEDTDLIRFARAISAKIKPAGSVPTLIERLPIGIVGSGDHTRVPGSERFVRGKAAFDATVAFAPKDELGASKGAVAVAAEYQLKGATPTLFIIDYRTNQDALNALRQWKHYLLIRKSQIKSEGDRRFSGTSPRDKGVAAAVYDNRLVGVTGALDGEKTLDRLYVWK